MDSRPRSTRRDFLQGKAAVDALAEVAASGLPSLPLEPPTPEAYLLQLARRAMACKFEFFLNAGQYSHDTETALAALDLLETLEQQLSVYRPDSEVSRLNRHAAEEAVEVEEQLFALLQQALKIFRETDGAYDITSARLSQAWGFTRRSGNIPAPETLLEARQRVGSQFVELDAEHKTVRFTREGLEINLGSIGKGYALDRCAELFEAVGITNFILHGGNSSVLARGSHAARAEGGWSVGIRNPLRPDRRLGQFILRDRALGTSGSGTQFFIHEGRRYGHILDPRTGWPAEGVLSVSVVASTAAEADALATAFYVLGPEGAESYCADHPQVAALMLCPGERAGSLQRHLWGFEADDWQEFATDH